MSHSCRRLAVAAVFAGTVLASTAAPAVAQESGVTDPRGDAPASADVTRVHISNGNHRIVVAVKVANLRHGTDMTLTINHDGPGRYILRTGGKGKGSLRFARGDNEKRVPCSRWMLARHTGERSSMKVTIPQHCFGDRAGTAAFNLTMFQAGGSGLDQIGALPITLRRS